MKLLFLFFAFICLKCYKIKDPFKVNKERFLQKQNKTGVVYSGTKNHTIYKVYGNIKRKENWMPVFTNIVSTKINVKVGKKPVIYLYPEEPMDISVHLNLKNSRLTTIYPKFNGKKTWNVHAESNGDIFIKDRKYPYLFWEALIYENQELNEGFIVKDEDAESFLEEKLSILGLNDKEKTDFITFWLPVLLRNKLSLYSFQQQKFFNSIELNITPKPDSLIRIFLSIKKLDAPINIKEQKLQSIERKGFTVIEWGGSDLSKREEF